MSYFLPVAHAAAADAHAVIKRQIAGHALVQLLLYKCARAVLRSATLQRCTSMRLASGILTGRRSKAGGE